MTSRAMRGRLVSFGDGPERPLLIERGTLLVEDGRIAAIGQNIDIPGGVEVDDHGDLLIMPGFIDTHLHYPQTQVIGSYGAQLLDWLQRYTFVEEQRFSDEAHARYVARFFFDELLRNGTTTACVYCTSHVQSAEAFFAESERRGTCMIAGKVMMDRGAPDRLLDTPERAHDESAALIGRWHGRGRQLYAITPRFAITSTEAQLEVAAALLREYPQCYLQTHLSENLREIETIAELFPWSKNYTNVYDHYGLLGERSIFGHCIHLDAEECSRLAATGSIAAFCPTSNLFIGSGLFNRRKLVDAGMVVTLATDIGGGTSYSMLRTAAEAYKVLQLQGQNLPAFEMFHMMTAGNAKALGLDSEIGTLAAGSIADLVVLDTYATPAMAHRMEAIVTDDPLQRLSEELFILATMGDDRSVREVYIMGNSCLPARGQATAVSGPFALKGSTSPR
ncbi:MAG: guanine deaminase [Geminicoccaceae bacterium]